MIYHKPMSGRSLEVVFSIQCLSTSNKNTHYLAALVYLRSAAWLVLMRIAEYENPLLPIKSSALINSGVSKLFSSGARFKIAGAPGSEAEGFTEARSAERGRVGEGATPSRRFFFFKLKIETAVFFLENCLKMVHSGVFSGS